MYLGFVHIAPWFCCYRFEIHLFFNCFRKQVNKISRITTAAKQASHSTLRWMWKFGIANRLAVFANSRDDYML